MLLLLLLLDTCFNKALCNKEIQSHSARLIITGSCRLYDSFCQSTILPFLTTICTVPLLHDQSKTIELSHRTHTCSTAAGWSYNVDRKLPIGHVVSRLRWVAAALLAAMVEKSSYQVSRTIGRTAGTILEECADLAMATTCAGNLHFNFTLGLAVMTPLFLEMENLDSRRVRQGPNSPPDLYTRPPWPWAWICWIWTSRSLIFALFQKQKPEPRQLIPRAVALLMRRAMGARASILAVGLSGLWELWFKKQGIIGGNEMRDE